MQSSRLALLTVQSVHERVHQAALSRLAATYERVCEEVKKAERNIISLDHLQLLSTDDAITKMLTFPGIGPKTAS